MGVRGARLVSGFMSSSTGDDATGGGVSVGGVTGAGVSGVLFGADMVVP
jgi:hypothetical protein